MEKTTEPLSLGLAVLPLAVMVALFSLGAIYTDMGGGLLVLVLLCAAAVAAGIASRRGHTWRDVEQSTGEKLGAVLPAILILLSIGMLIGTWVVGGTIPLLVYYGLQLVDPAYLVLTAFLATAVMSICTGTSWGSAGTIGVALIGMAGVLDMPLGQTAGAIVSGAYFGDKLSPLSDSTNISAIGAGAPLYAHIRHMLYTALPSTAVAALVYLFAASAPSSAEQPAAEALLDELDAIYALSPVALLPVAAVGIGILARIPPVIAMTLSAVMAVLVAVFYEGFSLNSALLSAVGGFDLTMIADKGLMPESLSDATRSLLSRGGLESMAGTLLVILAAFLLAGAMDVSGALDRLIRALLAAVHSTFGLIAATMAAGTTMISLTSHGGVTSLVIGDMFGGAYDRRGLARVNLSRSIEDSVTIVEPLLPWTVSAVYMATTLGVPTLEYAPWAFFCSGGPLFSLLYAAAFDRTGVGLKQSDRVAQ